ncbi:FtsX-like permease family protein [Streptomyces avicenniae]|uniref:FtsX-like permease family protein n=1 Tax=Streptomyces avicenniae TaxID=500153 RepID=UPI00069B62D6|nr:FtsX-like permease family protein [Streptomyces avicenniae]
MSALSTWRLALRIARRDALRAKGRSALVVAMIALPILGVSAADVVFRSGELSPREELTRSMGAADARYRLESDGQVEQSFDGESVSWTDPEGDVPPPPDLDGRPPVSLTPLLPDDATVLSDLSTYLRIDVGDGIVRAALREIDISDPLTEGMLTPLDGRLPEGPGEVVVTENFLDRSGLSLGDDLTLAGTDVSAEVVGTYEIPSELNTDEIIARPGALIARLAGTDAEDSLTASYLVAVPGDVDWSAVKEANAEGYTVVSRAVRLDPPPAEEGYGLDWGSSADLTAEAFVGVGTVVSLVVLEICLLAGPAFAVGVRRSRRQLGLIGANGGDRRHLRAITLASGIVLGAVAAVVGVVLGILGTMAARPFIEEAVGQRFGAWDLRVLELGAIAALAVLVGTCAALVPAVTASRGDVLESLTGRRGVRRGSRVLPVVGGVALVLGAVVALAGAVMMDDATFVAAGAIVAELGVVALTPALVGAFGRLGRRLPLSGRLALRDAARNRGRSAPAVAAILAAVAGLVTVSTVLVSEDARNRADYAAAVPEGTVSMNLWEYDDSSASALARSRQAAERELPVAERADVSAVVLDEDECDSSGTCSYQAIAVPEANRCPMSGGDDAQRLTHEERLRLADDPRCLNSVSNGSMAMISVAVAGPELLRVLGVDTPETLRTLDEGGAVVFNDLYRSAEGETTFEYWESPGEDEWDENGNLVAAPDSSWTFPSVTAPGDGPVDMLISPETAEAAGLRAVDTASFWSTSAAPDDAERRAFDGAMDGFGDAMSWDVERGYESSTSLPLLVLTLVALVLTIGAAGIATGLAQADSAADLATLAAVGAAPRVRRTLSGLQCGVIALMGVVLGAVSGLVPGIAMVLADHRTQNRWWEESLESGWVDGGRPELFLELPWATFGELLIGVPLVACLLAALLTRSRITLARRAG